MVEGTKNLKVPNLTLRNDSKKSSKALTQLLDGTRVRVLQTKRSRWWRVKVLTGSSTGTEGWVFAAYLAEITQ